jgi:ketosteroid isomerase-like protein
VSRENVELVRRGYAAWNAGDLESVIDSLDPEVEWQGHPMLPEPGPHHGREAVRRWLEDLRGTWSAFSADPAELVDAGDAVVALVRMAGRGRGSGVEVSGGVDVHVWTLGQGRAIRLQMYQGDEAASKADLSSRERDALKLRLADGLADIEIAERIGVPEGAVQPIIEGALGKLCDLASGAAR